MLQCCTADSDLFCSICIALSRYPRRGLLVVEAKVDSGKVDASASLRRRYIRSPFRSMGTTACSCTGRATERQGQSRRRVPVYVVLSYGLLVIVGLVVNPLMNSCIARRIPCRNVCWPGPSRTHPLCCTSTTASRPALPAMWASHVETLPKPRPASPSVPLPISPQLVPPCN